MVFTPGHEDGGTLGVRQRSAAASDSGPRAPGRAVRSDPAGTFRAWAVPSERLGGDLRRDG